MQRYFDHRNLRSLRLLDNPSDDSYLDAFNRHNEQPVANSRSKRSTSDNKKVLNPEPTLIKFEVSDAVEPNSEVKDLIRQYRARQIDLISKPSADELTKPQKRELITVSTAKGKPSTYSKPVKSLSNRSNIRSFTTKRLERTRRSAVQQQPKNFQVHFIPFEASDAREPDEQTKALIKRMRALDIEKVTKELTNSNGNTAAISTSTRRPYVKRTKSFKPKLSKRSKRDAPEMIKFEMSDAKEPSEALKSHMQTKERQAKDLKDQEQTVGENGKSDDQGSQASKRYFTYKEAPIKIKKSLSALPHDVQNVISQVLKGGKAYLKYIPAQQMDYSLLKAAHQQPKYGGHIGQYLKYVPAKAEPVQVQIHSVPVVQKYKYVYAPVAAAEAGGHVAAAGHGYGAYGAHEAYVGHEAQGAQVAHAGNAEIAHPIVVAEPIKQPEVHYSYVAAELAKPAAEPIPAKQPEIHYSYVAEPAKPAAAEDFLKIAEAPKFKPSKPDPAPEPEYEVAPTVEHYAKSYTNNVQTQDFKLKLYAPEALIAKAQLEAKAKIAAIERHNEKVAAAAYHGGGGGGGGEAKAAGGVEEKAAGYDGESGAHVGPVIKIEYHAPADTLKENYKELPEFKELSTLVGKSPEDQIHGLTFLLAKEMQQRLHLQREQKQGGLGGEDKAEGAAGGYEARPQDNKAPILFHPEDAVNHAAAAAVAAHHHGASYGGGKYLALHPGKIIGMAKTKQYVPVIEHGVGEYHAAVAAEKPAQEKQAAAVGGLGKAQSYMSYGLSPNYKGLSAIKSGNHGGGMVAHNANAIHAAGYNEAMAKVSNFVVLLYSQTNKQPRCF